MEYVHAEYRTEEVVDGVGTVIGTLPGTPWRPEGGICVSGEVGFLWRHQARELAAALVAVADRLDSVADERYGAITRATAAEG